MVFFFATFLGYNFLIHIYCWLYVCAPYFQPPVSFTRIQVSLSDFLDGPCHTSRWRWRCPHTRSYVGFLWLCSRHPGSLSCEGFRQSKDRWAALQSVYGEQAGGRAPREGCGCGEGGEELPGSRANKSPGCYPGDTFLPCHSRHWDRQPAWGADQVVSGVVLLHVCSEKRGSRTGLVREGSGKWDWILDGMKGSVFSLD